MIVETSKIFTATKNAKTRVIVHEGSSRSTKTYSIIQFLIYICITRKTKITAARKHLTWLKATAMVDFKDIMGMFGVWEDKRFNKVECEYEFENGSLFSFIGLDEPQKVHGRKQNIVWINEAIECNYHDYQQLALRTIDRIIIDYNPSAEQHWLYEKVIPRDDCTFIKSTYKDNPFLSVSQIQEIERLEPNERNIEQGTADETLWKIYGLGERAAHKGLIFSKVKLIESLPPVDEWKKHWYGLDFGFTNDPSCLVLCVLAHGSLYFKQMFYEKGLVNQANSAGTPSIEGWLRELKIPFDAHIWADSAEPKSIQELNNAGYFGVMGAEKGPDSVNVGIDLILSYNSFITIDSLDGIREKNNYKWKVDKEGNTTNKPMDCFNHFWDAARMGCYMELDDVRREKKFKAIEKKEDKTSFATLEEKINYLKSTKKKETKGNYL